MNTDGQSEQEKGLSPPPSNAEGDAKEQSVMSEDIRVRGEKRGEDGTSKSKLSIVGKSTAVDITVGEELKEGNAKL